jgi:hypothetical protein
VKTLIDIVAVFAFFGGLVFMATYQLTAPWWRSRAGINLMLFTSAATLLFGLRCLAMVFGDGFWGQDFLRLLLFSTIAVTVWHRWTLLVRAQVAGFHHADDVPPPHSPIPPG